jgi:predicted acylesterase/phospholipase RssA
MIPDPEGSGRQVPLQGGGAHGAFTWGVLDRLLDEAWLRIEGILPSLRTSFDAGANASVLPALSVASLVGFGAVVAALPAFGMVRDFVLTIEGGPLVSLALRSMSWPR